MRLLRNAIALLGLCLGTAASAYPVQIDINAGLSDRFYFITDSSNVSIQSNPSTDPALAGSSVSLFAMYNGPSPPPPANSGLSPLPPGNYTYYEQFDIMFGLDFAIKDKDYFYASGSQITQSDPPATVTTLDYDVGPGGVVPNDNPPDFEVQSLFIHSFQLSRLTTVPVPASAPLFGAGLIVLGAAGYVAKRMATTAA